MTDDTKKDDLLEKAKEIVRIDQGVECGFHFFDTLKDGREVELYELIGSLVQRVEEAEAPGRHCWDCCCARAWEALGIDTTTGKSIFEHIADLKAEKERLEKLLDSIENLDEKADKASWIEQCEDARKLALELSGQVDTLKAENALLLNNLTISEEKEGRLIDENRSLERSLSAARKALKALSEACLKYDSAINSCGNDPRKMSSFCTAEGKYLDDLYDAWRTLAAGSGGADRLVDAEKTIPHHFVDVNKMVANGSGGEKEKCKKCAGRGEVFSPSNKSTIWKTCVDCEGSGLEPKKGA